MLGIHGLPRQELELTGYRMVCYISALLRDVVDTGNKRWVSVVVLRTHADCGFARLMLIGCFSLRIVLL